MTKYYIDSKRGLDTNTGLSKASPWRSLEAVRAKLLTGTVQAGDMFLFEGESEFKPTRYLRIGSGFETSTYINGTSNNPIIFGKYDYGVRTNKKPTFELNYRPKVSDWKWDAVKGLWYWEHPAAYESNNLTWGHYPMVTLGGKLCQVTKFESATFTRGYDPATYHEVSVYQITTPGRLYMWTPNASANPATNPSSVYGDTIVASSNATAIFQFNRCGSYIKVDNLVAKKSGALVSPYNDASSTGDVVSFTVQNCESYDCGNLVVAGMVDSVKNIDGLKILNNKAYSCVGGAFHGGSKNLLFKGNYVRSVNLGRSDGGGVYIVGGYPGYGGYIEDNIFIDAKYETGGCTTDGCGIYLETGTIGMTVRRNTIANSPLALQDNTGNGSNLWHSNLIINCDKVINISDQDNKAISPITIRFYHNTAINCGMNALYPTMPGARFTAISCRKGPTRPASNYTYDMRNNILMGVGTAVNSGYGVLTESGSSLTMLNNIVVGFKSVKADEYSFANPVTPATTITVDPNLSESGRLKPGSPAINTGANTGLILTDRDNSLFKINQPFNPSIGCFEYYPANNLLENLAA